MFHAPAHKSSTAGQVAVRRYAVQIPLRSFRSEDDTYTGNPMNALLTACNMDDRHHREGDYRYGFVGSLDAPERLPAGSTLHTVDIAGMPLAVFGREARR